MKDWENRGCVRQGDLLQNSKWLRYLFILKTVDFTRTLLENRDLQPYSWSIVCVNVGACVSVLLCLEAWVDVQVFLSHSPLHLLRQRPSRNLELTDLVGWGPVSFSHPPASTISSSGITAGAHGFGCRGFELWSSCLAAGT